MNKFGTVHTVPVVLSTEMDIEKISTRLSENISYPDNDYPLLNYLGLPQTRIADSERGQDVHILWFKGE